MSLSEKLTFLQRLFYACSSSAKMSVKGRDDYLNQSYKWHMLQAEEHVDAAIEELVELLEKAGYMPTIREVQ